MRRHIKNFALLVTVASISAICIGSSAGMLTPTAYAATNIEFKVIDAYTQQSLEGVLAFVSWQNLGTNIVTRKPCFENCGPTCVQLVNVATGHSDSEGKIDIPGWLGKWGHCTYMPDDQPVILLYKPGYKVRKLLNANGPRAILSPPSMSVSNWNGATIELKPLGPHVKYMNGDDNYALNLMEFNDGLGVLQQYPNAERCFWGEARPALLLLMQEERSLTRYLSPTTELLDKKLSTPPNREDDWRCGDQGDYLASLQAEVNATQQKMLTAAHGGDSGVEAQVRGVAEKQDGDVDNLPPPKTACEELLPTTLRVELVQSYIGWRIAPPSYPDSGIDDTGKDDRSCNAVLKGDFIEQHQTSYAILLISVEDRADQVVIASPKGKNWNIQQLQSAYCYNSSICSVESAPAGNYAGVEYINHRSEFSIVKKRVTIDHDGIFHRSKRDEKVLFYYQDGRWQALYGLSL